ncbi:hypothetical protein BOC41_22780 [Burkholderia pseudomallei]|uniref:OmpW/AlkL family protein n=1 Tax=Burkholderia pseudomallei TaxID=28450 RepID=UPI000A1C8880|nr:OmpW family outer membrane protein [Burkholderia pseudomallei]OSP93256.1 hypothetical protein BOC41_22780 [Burkholderia pseudomallei]
MAHFTLRSAPARSFFAVAAAIAMAAPLAHAQSNEDQISDGSFYDRYIRGRNVLSVGVLHIHPTDSSTPLSTSTSALGLGTYESPGTSAKTGSSTTLSFTQTYFVNDNWAVTAVGGIPPTTKIYGRGKVIAPVPGLGNLTLIDLGQPQNNPVATARAWNPALIGQYYFGTAQSKLRPFVGAGISYNFFTQLRLNPNFVTAMQNLGQVLQLGMGQIPTEAGREKWKPTFRKIEKRRHE